MKFHSQMPKNLSHLVFSSFCFHSSFSTGLTSSSGIVSNLAGGNPARAFDAEEVGFSEQKAGFLEWFLDGFWVVFCWFRWFLLVFGWFFSWFQLGFGGFLLVSAWFLWLFVGLSLVSVVFCLVL